MKSSNPNYDPISSSDDEDEYQPSAAAAQASAMDHYVGVSDDEEFTVPVLLDGTTRDFIDFRNILAQSGLDRTRPGILRKNYECNKCGNSIGEYTCSKGHCICFRCLNFVSNGTLVSVCLDCRPKDEENIYIDDKSQEFKEFKDMFRAFRPCCRGLPLTEFFNMYPPLDPSLFERKYLKYKQKYIALKNRGL
jgi:hypothetical protein